MKYLRNQFISKQKTSFHHCKAEFQSTQWLIFLRKKNNRQKETTEFHVSWVHDTRKFAAQLNEGMQEKRFCTKNIKIKCWSMLRLAAFCEIIRIDITIRPGSEGSDPSTRDPDPARGCLRSASLPLQHYQKPKPLLKLVPSWSFFLYSLI